MRLMFTVWCCVVVGDRPGTSLRVQPHHGQAGEGHALWWRGHQPRGPPGFATVTDGRPLLATHRTAGRQTTGRYSYVIWLVGGVGWGGVGWGGVGWGGVGWGGVGWGGVGWGGVGWGGVGWGGVGWGGVGWGGVGWGGVGWGGVGWGGVGWGGVGWGGGGVG